MSLAAAATVVSRVVNATDRLQMEAIVVIGPSFRSGSTVGVFNPIHRFEVASG
jgi:hypothetical protein